jgi:hypothetical protein
MSANIVDLATRRIAELEIVLACAVTIAGKPAYELLQAAKWTPETEREVVALWTLVPIILSKSDVHAAFERHFSLGRYSTIRKWESVYADLVPSELISTYDAIPWALKEIRYMKQLRWLINHLAETLQRDANHAD